MRTILAQESALKHTREGQKEMDLRSPAAQEPAPSPLGESSDSASFVWRFTDAVDTILEERESQKTSSRSAARKRGASSHNAKGAATKAVAEPKTKQQDEVYGTPPAKKARKLKEIETPEDIDTAVSPESPMRLANLPPHVLQLLQSLPGGKDQVNALVAAALSEPGTNTEKAERLARAMRDLDARSQTDREALFEKRKEAERVREYTERERADKVQEARKQLDVEQDARRAGQQHLNQLFNDLQVAAKDIGTNIDVPEIVVVGMQSDGKSSLIEGFLGFQFNIVESTIGTRRPLIIQMINDPGCDRAPVCRFRKEHPPENSEDAFEFHETPPHEICREIVARTNAIAGAEPNSVSALPIILHVRYAYCANLTIYDTPGFRSGGDARLQRAIEEMVMDLTRPSHRIIVCLEQATVEWANSNSRPMAQRVDPTFQRTVVVCTKFDNRVKELRDADSASRYLDGLAQEYCDQNLLLSGPLTPFFVSMPLRRNLDANRFCEHIKSAFLDDYEKLLEVGFDEERFLPRLGFFALKHHLENLLASRFERALVPTLETLAMRCETVKREHEAVSASLAETDLEVLRQRAHEFVKLFANVIAYFLDDTGRMMAPPGANSSMPNGQTLQEEMTACRETEQHGEAPAITDFWKILGQKPTKFENQQAALDTIATQKKSAMTRKASPAASDIDSIPCANLRLFGAAQFHRLVSEFTRACDKTTLIPPTTQETAAALGPRIHEIVGHRSLATEIVYDAAGKIARDAAKRQLLPLADVLALRITHIVLELFQPAIYAADEAQCQEQESAISQKFAKSFHGDDFMAQALALVSQADDSANRAAKKLRMSVYADFVEEIKTTFKALVMKSALDARANAQADFMSYMSRPKDLELLRRALIGGNIQLEEADERSGSASEGKNAFEAIAAAAEQKFLHAKVLFSALVNNSMRAAFFERMLATIPGAIIRRFTAFATDRENSLLISDDQYERMLSGDTAALKEHQHSLAMQLQMLQQQRDQFCAAVEMAHEHRALH